MAAPVGVSNTTTVLAPPDPVTTAVLHKFYKGSDLIFVVWGPPNATIPIPIPIGQGWTVKARAYANGEFSTAEDTEEFDGEDPLDYQFSPTNSSIPGPTLNLEYDA